jgi:hypothetical protein
MGLETEKTRSAYSHPWGRQGSSRATIYEHNNNNKKKNLKCLRQRKENKAALSYLILK